MGLSEQARSIWAKSKRAGEDGNPMAGPVTKWLSLVQHLDDAGGIAALLWDERFWAEGVRARIITACGGNEGVARAAVELLSATHDVGKASPAFLSQVPELAVLAQQAGLSIRPRVVNDPERSSVRHEIVSYLAFKSWLRARADRPRQDPAIALATVIGSHHGRPLQPSRVQSAGALEHLSGDEAWQKVQRELIGWAAARPAVAPYIERILAIQWSQQDLVTLTGMTVVADWIASDDEYFSLADIGLAEFTVTEDRARAAWQRYDPPPTWRPEPGADDESLLRERFHFPAGAQLFPAQLALAAKARVTPRPSLLILEAPMGSGKTEAALAAAEILADRFGQGGLFVALPTQATADGMWNRVRAWADRAGLGTSVFLAHGRSSLNDDYDQLTREAGFASIDEGGNSGKAQPSDGTVIAHKWFRGNKKGPLANLVVGTIDQVLFAALQSRFVALRHLSIAGKVVVIDEVHAVDTYMGEFLDRAIEWMGAYQVPVVMLSATLPTRRRWALVQAYEKGRASAGLSAADAEAAAGLAADIGYPLVIDSADPAGYVVPEVSGLERDITLEWLPDDLEALGAMLRVRLTDGGTAVVIRNTVGRAQEAAAYLAAALDDTEVSLMHSRFLAGVRAQADRELLRCFGRDASHRPHRAVVVATQVVEQSLDVDFDLMVTDLAPIDLLLQRAGRLHRHDRELNARPELLRAPSLVVTAVDSCEVPPGLDGGGKYVYGAHLLLRTLAELEGRAQIVLPRDIAPMVQRVYGDADYPKEGWIEALAQADRAHGVEVDKHRAEAMPFVLDRVKRRAGLLGWPEHAAGEGGADDHQGYATVRRTEDSLEVLVLFSGPDELGLSTPPWWPDCVQIPLNGELSWSLVRSVQRTAIRLPNQLCQRYGALSLIGDIEALLWKHPSLQVLQGSRMLRGELVLVFDASGKCQLAKGKPTLRYDQRNGLQLDYVSNE